jgi:hypothetical protein
MGAGALGEVGDDGSLHEVASNSASTGATEYRTEETRIQTSRLGGNELVVLDHDRMVFLM